ncbi:hypothetical protein ACA910_002906 [Epithemia clementina (nom. ined.)]
MSSSNTHFAAAGASSCTLDAASTAKKAACIPCSTLDPSFLLSDSVVKERLASSPKLRFWECSTVTMVEPDASLSLSSSTTTTTTTKHHHHHPCISRTFVARHFQAALNAINAMGAVAEEQGHHPDFHLTNYRNVRIDVWTHKVGGVTENDLVLAELFDEVPIDYSPKWLKEQVETKTSF